MSAGLKEKAFLIDASIVFFRYYYSMPDRWFSADFGFSTAATYGFCLWLQRLLIDQQPRYVAACFDESLGTCFRNDIDPNYKCSRPLADEGLKFQLMACKTVCELMGIPAYASNRYEADDLLGTLAAKNRQIGRNNVIISRDKDLGQLMNQGDALWHYPDGERLNMQKVTAQWGVAASQIPHLLALTGDVVDDIPGVPGVGPKTAAQLLRVAGTVEQLYSDLSCVALMPIRGARKLADKLAPFETQVMRALQLTTIDCDAPLGRRFQMRRRQMDWPSLVNYTQQLGFTLPHDLKLQKASI